MAVVTASGALGMSARTLARHFVQETGTSLRQWRQQLRLLENLFTLFSRTGIGPAICYF